VNGDWVAGIHSTGEVALGDEVFFMEPAFDGRKAQDPQDEPCM